MNAERYENLGRQLARAVREELSHIDASTTPIARVAWRPVQTGALTHPRRLAIVAADAGNVTLRLAPLRIAFVRVASSEDEAPVAELIFQPDQPPRELAQVLCAEVPSLIDPLRCAGVEPEALLAALLERRNRISAVREVLEWGAILLAAGRKREEPCLVVRDGLLRSIHVDSGSFSRIHRALLAACASSGNQVVAVAKTLPGGQDLVNALLLGGVMDRLPATDLAFLEIPRSLEEELLPPAFVEGRRMGPLVIARVKATGSFVPLEFSSEDPETIAAVIGSLFGTDVECFPVAGQPVEVLVAHHRARISALDRDWMRQEFLEQLGRSSERLARLAITAEVLGIGGPQLAEDLP